MQTKSAVSILKTSFNHWQEHRASRMGAALSFYTVFSIVPLLMLILVIINPFLGKGYIQDAIVEQIGIIINHQSAVFIQSILTGLNETKFDFFAVLIGFGTFIVAAVGVFYELKNSLDDLWDTKELKNETRSWKYFIFSRLLSLSIIPILGFLLIITLTFSSLLNYISFRLPDLLFL